MFANSSRFRWTFPFFLVYLSLPKTQEVIIMTQEKARQDFDKLIAANGFTEAAKTTDTLNTVYHRIWTREVEVAWYGKQQDTLEIRMMLCGTAVLASVIRNGKDDPKFIRDYSSPKRAMNAAREIVTLAGFEW